MTLSIHKPGQHNHELLTSDTGVTQTVASSRVESRSTRGDRLPNSEGLSLPSTVYVGTGVSLSEGGGGAVGLGVETGRGGGLAFAGGEGVVGGVEVSDGHDLGGRTKSE